MKLKASARYVVIHEFLPRDVHGKDVSEARKALMSRLSDVLLHDARHEIEKGSLYHVTEEGILVIAYSLRQLKENNG